MIKAGFPRGEFVRANKQKANVIGWRCRQCLSPANQVAFFSVRANKFAKWKTGFTFHGMPEAIVIQAKGYASTPPKNGDTNGPELDSRLNYSRWLMSNSSLDYSRWLISKWMTN